MGKNDKLINQINKIVQANLNRINEYEMAYSIVKSKILRDLFEQCISQSRLYTSKLHFMLLFQDLESRVRPSIFASFFGGWMQLKASISKNKDLSILKCCLDAEDMIAAIYRLVGENKDLHYHYPLLKDTFLKQELSLEQIRGQIVTAIKTENLKVIDSGNASTSRHIYSMHRANI